MKLEHVALNVPAPVEMADWYSRNLGLEMVRSNSEPPYAHFLRDSGGRMMFEIYSNSEADVPDYEAMNPLILHFAFVSESPADDRDRLLKAGATLVSDEQPDDASHIVMMRDPWGVPIQFCKRGIGMLAGQE